MLARWVQKLLVEQVFFRLDDAALRAFDVLSLDSLKEIDPRGPGMVPLMCKAHKDFPWEYIVQDVVRRDVLSTVPREVRVTVTEDSPYGMVLRHPCRGFPCRPEPEAASPTGGAITPRAPLRSIGRGYSFDSHAGSSDDNPEGVAAVEVAMPGVPLRAGGRSGGHHGHGDAPLAQDARSPATQSGWAAAVNRRGGRQASRSAGPRRGERVDNRGNRVQSPPAPRRATSSSEAFVTTELARLELVKVFGDRIARELMGQVVPTGGGVAALLRLLGDVLAELHQGMAEAGRQPPMQAIDQTVEVTARLLDRRHLANGLLCRISEVSRQEEVVPSQPVWAFDLDARLGRRRREDGADEGPVRQRSCDRRRP